MLEILKTVRRLNVTLVTFCAAASLVLLQVAQMPSYESQIHVIQEYVDARRTLRDWEDRNGTVERSVKAALESEIRIALGLPDHELGELCSDTILDLVAIADHFAYVHVDWGLDATLEWLAQAPEPKARVYAADLSGVVEALRNVFAVSLCPAVTAPRTEFARTEPGALNVPVSWSIELEFKDESNTQLRRRLGMVLEPFGPHRFEIEIHERRRQTRIFIHGAQLADRIWENEIEELLSEKCLGERVECRKLQQALTRSRKMGLSKLQPAPDVWAQIRPLSPERAISVLGKLHNDMGETAFTLLGMAVKCSWVAGFVTGTVFVLLLLTGVALEDARRYVRSEEYTDFENDLYPGPGIMCMSLGRLVESGLAMLCPIAVLVIIFFSRPGGVVLVAAPVLIVVALGFRIWTGWRFRNAATRKSQETGSEGEPKPTTSQRENPR